MPFWARFGCEVVAKLQSAVIWLSTKTLILFKGFSCGKPCPNLLSHAYWHVQVGMGMKGDIMKSINFPFLEEHDAVFLQLAVTAERVFFSDPNTTLIKLRQLGEALAQNIAARCGIGFDDQTSQADLLYKINRELRLDPEIRTLFHTLRIEGNKATH
jgi:hypothetical protein